MVGGEVVNHAQRDDAALRSVYRQLLSDARERTLALTEPISDEVLDRVHDQLMSPISWDLGHIAAFEDLWLCQQVGGYEPLYPELAAVYDASLTPRAVRGESKALTAPQAREFMSRARARSLAVLETVSLTDPSDPLNLDGFVWEMLVQHEHQHNETILQTLKLAEPGTYSPPRGSLPKPTPTSPTASAEMVRVDGGSFVLGTSEPGFVYDNERPSHTVELGPFRIDRTPVTNRAYAEFVESGGYERAEWWSEEGWQWRCEQRIERPLYWDAAGRERDFATWAKLDPNRPVTHVSWYEADAYARSRGKRLPTEAEWETAASWDPEKRRKRRYPWGDEPPNASRANLDHSAFGPAPVASFPDGSSAYGVMGLIGDVWEWTSSDFSPYPGFRPWPYPEYSQDFFDSGYKVLRGGSWATRARAVRSTFRNWDFPQRRQLMVGFRCAADE